MTPPSADNEPPGQRPADVPRKADVRVDVPCEPDPAIGELRVGEPRAGEPRPGEPTYPDVHIGDLSPDPARLRREYPDPDNVDPDEYEFAESALGGADTVQKTSYVTGEGAEPSGAPRAAVVARTSSGGGINVTAWVIGLIAFAVALVYGIGIFL